jgi:uncharacterized alkaline shock family protein YloU
MTNSTITIAPEVVRTLVRNTVLAMPDVVAIADTDREKRNGVTVKLEPGDCATVNLRLIASPDVPLHALGKQVQSTVAEVAEEVAGLCVTQVDIVFENVRK